MRIGFDLDRIFIKYPPLVPPGLIDWLYKSHNTSGLSYRIPTNRLEIAIRKLSHLPFFRRPLVENIEFVNRLSRNKNYQLYLISSRYDFLEKITRQLLERYRLAPTFINVSLNTANEQAHLFKEKILRKYQIEVYIDDDEELLAYLTSRLPGLEFIRYTPGVPLEKYFSQL